jgi:hypothetical protein
MNKYKYFFQRDKVKEAIGKVTARTLEEAYIKASEIKNLTLEDFKGVFKVEEDGRGKV